MCQRGSATIAACYGRQQFTQLYGQSPESNITNQTWSTDARKSLESQPKLLENRSKISRKSSPNRSLTVRVTKIAPGRLLARCFRRPNRARAAPRALLGYPRAAKSAWRAFLGVPRTVKNAAGKPPGRNWSPFVLASAAQHARGSIFEGFRGELPAFFWIARASILDRFGDRFLIAFRSLFRSVSSSRGKNPIGAEP